MAELLEKLQLLEEELTDTRRFGSNLDLEILRLEDRGYRQPIVTEVRAVVDTSRLKRGGRNLRLTGVHTNEPHYAYARRQRIESRGVMDDQRSLLSHKRAPRYEDVSRSLDA